MRIAVIGAGIAGNVAAARLHGAHEITVFEAAPHIGGHTHTHEIEVANRRVVVDTGFIVYNERTYPRFTALLAQLGVATQESSMSFSVRDEATGLEYNGTSLNALFAQRRNLLRPAFLGMVRDILRFHREAPGILDGHGPELALGEFLAAGRYGRAFRELYIVPMGAAIWSTDPAQMLDFPARFFVRFLHNHGMLTVNDRPVWRTIVGGSARYVERLTAPFADRIRLAAPVELVRRLPGGVLVKARGHEAQRFDAVFLACHSDEALRLLGDADPAEREVLGAIPYRRNEAVLHTDGRLLPRSALARAAWNYHRLAEPAGPVALTYCMNILQRLEVPVPLLVTLNRAAAIDPARVIRRMSYAHPVFTPASVAAQARQRELNGARRTYYCGAWWRNGFHEDGVVSAEAAVRHFEEDHAQRRLYRSA
jgi:predicted NAD/FAD-binding protein